MKTELNNREKEVVDYIARCIRNKDVHEPVGIFIYSTCMDMGADPHLIAKALGERNKYKRKNKPWIYT